VLEFLNKFGVDVLLRGNTYGNHDRTHYLSRKTRENYADPEEQEKAKVDLGSILGYIDKLNELDTDSVQPLSHAFRTTNVFREDIVTNSDSRERILANAPIRGRLLQGSKNIRLTSRGAQYTGKEGLSLWIENRLWP
jgi:aspartyl/glutamyl-tRNA(Asn/Gln) amidotransferase C subunit